MIRKRIIEDSTEPEPVRRLRDDLYNEIGTGTRVLLCRVEEVQNDGTVIVNVDGRRIEAANYAVLELNVGENVAVIEDTDRSAYIIGVKR